jgi:hypothetical protein
MARIDRHVRINAPRDIVWGVLTTSDAWDSWGDFTHSARVADGEGHPDGIGSVREVWTAGLVPTREEVVAFDEDAGHYEYVMTAGPPVKDYRGEVRLTDDGEGTQVHWISTFNPPLPIPGAGFVLSRVLGVILSRLTGGLKRQAEQVAAAARP